MEFVLGAGVIFIAYKFIDVYVVSNEVRTQATASDWSFLKQIMFWFMVILGIFLFLIAFIALFPLSIIPVVAAVLTWYYCLRPKN